MKTKEIYFVRYANGQEEKIEADDFKLTAKLFSFYRDKKLVLLVPVVEISRVSLTEFVPYHRETRPLDTTTVAKYLKDRGIAPKLNGQDKK
jgi:hypothetical protein